MKNCPTCHATYPNDFSLCPKDGAPLRSTSEIAEGTVLRGRYQILAKLGEGGMGSVYKAQHTHFHEIWALKVVSRNLLEEPGFLERFRAESLLMRRLNHPNAVRVHDYDETDDGRPFMVMEFVEGTGLDKLTGEGKRLEPERAVRIVMQVCDALGAAHRLGIIHRDIKPSNIVVTTGPDGSDVAKVLDFGIAKVKEQGTMHQASLTGTGMIVGTPAYMSPEQVMGARGDKLDGRADLYSLGVVLYELLAGRTPFVADTPVALLMAHASTPPPDPRTLRGTLPGPLVTVVMRTLEKEPAKRFATAEEMRDALAATLVPEGAEPTHRLPAVAASPATTGSQRAISEVETATRLKTPLPQPSPIPKPEPSPAGVAEPATAPAAQARTAVPEAEAIPAPSTAQQPAGRIEEPTSRKPLYLAVTGIVAVIVAGSAWYFLRSGEGKQPVPIVSPAPKEAQPQPKETAPPVVTPAPEEHSPSNEGKAADTKAETAKAEAAHNREVTAAATVGDFFYENGEYDNAIKEYEKGLKIDPSSPKLREKLRRAQRAKAAEGEVGSSKRVTIGAGVQAGKLLKKIAPQYPEIARQARVQGTVKLHAVIGKDGAVTQLDVVSGPPLLLQAATDAVRQWRYKPTLVNGEPVEVDTTIDVVFTLNP